VGHGRGDLLLFSDQRDMKDVQVNPLKRTGVTLTDGTRMRAAMSVAIIADLLQIFVFPLFIEGAASPMDDVLDVCVGGVLSYLLGWHWEFLPSFLAKLVPGVDLVPLWSLAVGNVFRKSKQLPVTLEGQVEGPTIEGERRKP
jgi:hypothetical protein